MCHTYLFKCDNFHTNVPIYQLYILSNYNKYFNFRVLGTNKQHIGQQLKQLDFAIKQTHRLGIQMAIICTKSNAQKSQCMIFCHVYSNLCSSVHKLEYTWHKSMLKLCCALDFVQNIVPWITSHTCMQHKRAFKGKWRSTNN